MSQAAAYKYLNCARQLGVVECRNGVLYPVRPQTGLRADHEANG
jgi:hypothetical protein